MGQVTIYLEDEIEAKMTEAARRANLSKSKWIACLINAEVSNKWPEFVIELAGSWGDFPTAEALREAIRQDQEHELL